MSEEDMVLRTMMTTIIETQQTMAKEISDIKMSMIEIVRIEEKQISQKEAINRIGKQVDKNDGRLDVLEVSYAEMKNTQGNLSGRVALLAGGIATVVTSVVIMVIKYVFDK